MNDSTDNTINISDRLPPEVRKPWRQKLPDCYANRIDDLLALEKQIRAIQEELCEMRQRFGEVCDSDGVVCSAQDEIAAALVLLACAEEKLAYAVPTEEHMPKESIREFWGKGK